jgi:hypothetical protein
VTKSKLCDMKSIKEMSGPKQNKKKALHLISNNGKQAKFILRRPVLIFGKLNCLLYIYLKMNFQISCLVTL